MIRTSIDEIVVWVSGTGPDTFPKCVLFLGSVVYGPALTISVLHGTSTI
jgi:hypothetical protein